MKREDWLIMTGFLALIFLFGVAVGKRVYSTPPVVVNFTFTGATPQNVKGLTTAATEILQKKGVLPTFKP